MRKYALILEISCRKYLKKSGKSFKADEIYITVKGRWKYLYRAVDNTNQTIDFLLSYSRGKKASIDFFKKALGQPHVTSPDTINVNKNIAYQYAIVDLKSTKHLSTNYNLLQIKYLNNSIEQIIDLLKEGVAINNDLLPVILPK